MTELAPAQWAVVWLTDEGPQVDGPFPDIDAAMTGAYNGWVEYAGGVVGGFNDGTREEFERVFEYSGDVWVVPIGPPSEEAPA